MRRNSLNPRSTRFEVNWWLCYWPLIISHEGLAAWLKIAFRSICIALFMGHDPCEDRNKFRFQLRPGTIMWFLAVAYGLIQRSGSKWNLQKYSNKIKQVRILLSWEVWCDIEPCRDDSKISKHATRNHSRCSVLLHRPGEEGNGTAFGFSTEKEKSWKFDLCIR